MCVNSGGDSLLMVGVTDQDDVQALFDFGTSILIQRCHPYTGRCKI